MKKIYIFIAVSIIAALYISEQKKSAFPKQISKMHKQEGHDGVETLRAGPRHAKAVAGQKADATKDNSDNLSELDELKRQSELILEQLIAYDFPTSFQNGYLSDDDHIKIISLLEKQADLETKIAEIEVKRIHQEVESWY